VLYKRLLKQADIRQALIRSAGYLGLVLSLHSLAMMEFEGLALGDAVWLTLTTVVTVGYGDYAANTAFGRAATIVLLYVGGVFVLFHTAADYFEYRADRRLRMLRGRWRWHMKDHVLLLKAPRINTERYLFHFGRELRRTTRYEDSSVLVLTDRFPEGLTEPLQDLGMVHYHGQASDPEDLRACDAGDAAAILVLADHAEETTSDGATFDILHRLSEIGVKGRILAECVDDQNKERLKAAGAQIVVRPIRFYPEIEVRALEYPGSEAILENLFTSRSDECHGFTVRIRGLQWAKVVDRLMAEEVGTAIAYASADKGSIVCNPGPRTTVDANALFVIVKQGRIVPDKKIQAILDAVA
jgi:voltage-gated potassium channel